MINQKSSNNQFCILTMKLFLSVSQTQKFRPKSGVIYKKSRLLYRGWKIKSLRCAVTKFEHYYEYCNPADMAQK